MSEKIPADVLSIAAGREVREIPGFPDYYVTEDGIVISGNYYRQGHAQELKPGRIGPPKRHYFAVSLPQEGTFVMWGVHRLVALAFIGPPPFEGAIVRHLNDDQLNNHVSNLAYGTRADNIKDAQANSGAFQGERIGIAKLTEGNVTEIRELYAAGGYTQEELGKMFGVTQSNVSFIIRRKGWRHIA